MLIYTVYIYIYTYTFLQYTYIYIYIATHDETRAMFFSFNVFCPVIHHPDQPWFASKKGALLETQRHQQIKKISLDQAL